MLPIIGSLLVLLSVIGGFMASKGHLGALWQPFELLIIGGSALGAYLASNSMGVVKETFRSCLSILKGPKYGKPQYLAILSLLYDVLSKIRKSGVMSLEDDVDNPSGSELFAKYPEMLADHHLLEFMTDCLRLMIGGNINPHELEPLLELELETHHHEALAPAHALQKAADGLPGFGIVAAVLGIVITMGSLDGPVNEIGHHVAAALVGTFLGILLAYGFIGPLAAAIEGRVIEDSRAFECVKAGLLASLRGYNPIVAIEFARKSLNARMRPPFAELESHLKGSR
ncbi:flagellar motor stator protein MotA [Solimonas terrae]|uniref:Flagellar motor stator protein MotA n=1 Tax=Solimonas terrae TaxID=1396819 RepID=A0A6M2BN60_9GAMM|nr:flagellar motor stator protein MotA [Solimonas terrae]NGY03878.1 flagellar motor stator protein MotA [Solimonas terrae]